jgi:hypothetical protein
MLSVKQAKRVAAAVIGFSVLLVGLAMIVLPGPAIVLIPLGLGILATEFLWATRLLNRIKCRVLKKEDSCPDPTTSREPRRIRNLIRRPLLPPKDTDPESFGG